MKCTKIERITVELQFLASNKTIANLLFSEEFSLSSIFCLYSHSVVKWTIPHSQCALVKYGSIVELPTVFKLSLYEWCWNSGTMHHSLCYYTHIFQQHPFQKWMVVHMFSSARGGRGDFSCPFSYHFSFFLGEGVGVDMWMHNHLICHAGHHGVRFIRHKK